MSARPLISLLLITALVLPSSLCAGPEKSDSDTATQSLLQRAAPGKTIPAETADVEAGSHNGPVSRDDYDELKRQHRGARSAVAIATVAFVIETTIVCIALAGGWIKLYTDCKQ